jgi:putative tricarboxylic transport membrane protein
MRAERLVALVVLAGGGLYLSQALRLPMGTSARPGAAFFPVSIAIFACLVGVVALVRSFVGEPRVRAVADAVVWSPDRRNRVLATVIVLVAFCLLLPWVGYPVMAFVFVAVLLRKLGSGWPGAVLTGVLTAVLSFYVFAVLLDVPLPRGPW